MRAIFLIVLAITLMVLDRHYIAVAQLRAALSMPLAPLQYLVSWPVNLIDKISQNISTHDALIKENLDLRAEQLFLAAQVQRLTALETENNQLKGLLKSSAQIKGKIEIAQLLAVDSDPFIHQVIVNKGSSDGVYLGQPVLDAGGVMGQLIQIGPLMSRILLVNDPHSGVPVQDVRNGIRAILTGDSYTGKLRLLNISQTVDIREHDAFVTSGLGKNYPEGYPVGHVVSVKHDPSNSFATIILEPDAHLDRSRQVLLIWPNKMSNARVSHA